MKKITLGFITLLIMCFLVGCGTIGKIQQKLDKNDPQVIIALGNSFESKEALIKSSELNANGLIALCTKPSPMNMRNAEVQSWFIEAIERTELTAEQEVQIAKIGNFTYSKALLLKTNLTAEGLVAICENPVNLNLHNDEVKKWFREAIERTELTEEQKVRIAKSKIEGLGLY